MLLCHCEVVTDTEIRGEIAAGAFDADAVGDACGAGTGCGGCVPEIERLCGEARSAVDQARRVLDGAAAGLPTRIPTLSEV
jgi:bacterioferritin-associated ferredoxin